MSDFAPTAISVEQKGARMTAMYATVDGEQVFLGSALSSGTTDSGVKMNWIADAIEAHYGVPVSRPGAKKKKTAAPAKKAAPKKAKK